MVSKPVQSAPSFSTGLNGLMSAQLNFIKAKQAAAAGQWAQAGLLAQACVASAPPREKVYFLAKELLADTFVERNLTEQALAVFIELDHLKPNDAVLINNIGLALTYLLRHEDAIRYLQQAVAINPDYAIAHLNLGLAFSGNGDVTQAEKCYSRSLKIDPKLVQAKLNLGSLLIKKGFVDEAQREFEGVLQLEPKNLKALGGVIFAEHSRYPQNMPRQTELVRRYARLIEGDHTPRMISAIKKPLDSPLRVGMVSGDLRDHPVGYFLESTLSQIKIDPELSNRLTLIAYCNKSSQDEYTQRLRAEFDQWYQVDQMDDDSLVKKIKEDQVDILIDLSGITEHHRLPVFSKRAAPLQISWLGYFASTGLSSIDYVLADHISVPTNEEQWFSEKVWRLPHLRYCFSIPSHAPQVSPSPCINNPQVVFGCYQMLNKFNQSILLCWKRILDACPMARIRIQSKELSNDNVKADFIQRLNDLGLDLQRIDLVGKMSRQDYLASYSEVDILLDTFPYPGGTTTAEALWMGVPTLTLALPTMLGRQGEALMANAGLLDWVVHSEEDYVQKAISWGVADQHQRETLAKLRADMREQVKDSPVFNAKQFAGEFVDALYGMRKAKGESSTEQLFSSYQTNRTFTQYSL